MKRPENLIYAVDEWPSLPKLAALSLQQVSLVSIYLVLLVIVLREAGASPIAARNTLSFAMIAMGMGVVLQGLWRGPVGSGFLAPPVLTAIYLKVSIAAAQVGGMPLVAGMTMAAGGFEALMSRFLHRLRRVFPPVVSGIIITAVGFEVGLVGFKQFLCVVDTLCTRDFRMHLIVSTLTVGTMMGLSVWGRGLLRLFGSLLGMLVGLAAAVLAGLISPQAWVELAAAPLVALPGVSHLAYAFDSSLLIPFLVAGLAACLRTIGVVTTCQRINDADWQKPERRSIRGGVLADGLGTAVSGALGVTGISTAISAVGASKASGATSRYIALGMGAWFLALACLPKLAAVFLAFPPAVLGGTLVFSGSLVVGGGLQLMAAGNLDTRKTFIIATSLILAVSHQVYRSFFAGLPPWLHEITGSMLSIATITAIVLNLIFRFGIRRNAKLSVAGTAGSWEAADQWLLAEGRDWGVNSGDLLQASESIKCAVALIQEAQLAEGPVELEISYDEVDLVLELSYRGNPVQAPAPQQQPVASGEETPLARDLLAAWHCVPLEPLAPKTGEANCRIRLVF